MNEKEAPNALQVFDEMIGNKMLVPATFIENLNGGLSIVRSALQRLEDIEKRAEERRVEYKYAYTEGLSNDSVAGIIDYIIKGEGK